MGLSTPTLLVCLPFATSKAPTTCTTTLLASLGDPGGVFDAPKAKCPPDRGSSDWVTGSPASASPALSFSSRSLSSSDFSSSPDSINHSSSSPIASTYSAQPLVAPRAIPGTPSSYEDIDTPPLTPDDEDDDDKMPEKHSDDALEFLLQIFPQDGLSALSFAKSISISAPNMGMTFEGVCVELPGQPKTLYVDGKNAESVSLRESIVALLDLADESLQCSALVIALERSSPVLGDLLHSLMYVGGTVVTKPSFPSNPAFVLVGLEI